MTITPLSVLKSCGNQVWVKCCDLELNKPYKIASAFRHPSKFCTSKQQTVLILENSNQLTLSTRLTRTFKQGFM